MLKHVKYQQIGNTLDSINKATLDDLGDVDFVKNLIRSIGLYGANYDVYGDEEAFGSNNESGVWQEPTQSAKFLVWANDKNISTILEIGSWNGCWALFMATYFSRFNEVKTVSVDIKKTVLFEVRLLAEQHNLNFRIGSSIDFVGEFFDLVFIDGGRDFDVVKGHWDNVGKYAKICVFHDINCKFAPDIGVFWKQIRTTSCIEILDHTRGYKYDVMGIGIIC